MRKRAIGFALFGCFSFAALGQTVPAATALPKDWGAITPVYTPRVPSASMPALGASQVSLNQASLELLKAQTATIADLSDRLGKLESRIKELEAQMPGAQK